MYLIYLFPPCGRGKSVLEGEDARQGLADEPDALVALLVHRVVQVVLGLRRKSYLDFSNVVECKCNYIFNHLFEMFKKTINIILYQSKFGNTCADRARTHAVTVNDLLSLSHYQSYENFRRKTRLI